MSFRDHGCFMIMNTLCGLREECQNSSWLVRRQTLHLQSQSRVGNPTNDSTMYAEILVMSLFLFAELDIRYISRISYIIGIPAFLLISKFFSIISLICLICVTGILCKSRIVTPPLIYQLNSNKFLCVLSSSFSNFFCFSTISSPLAVANQLRKNLQDSSPVWLFLYDRIRSQDKQI